MNFEVVVLGQAERELNVIASWLAERSVEGALRWLEAFDGAKRALAANPFAHGFALESSFIDLEIRQILFGTRRGNRYRAVFTVEGSEVRILHIRGPGEPLLRADEL